LAGECKTGDIDNVCLLTNPAPAIVVLNSNASLEVRNLKSMKEFKFFLQQLRKGIDHFIAAPNKAGIKAAPSIAFNPEM
jgi:hypothetical protein